MTASKWKLRVKQLVLSVVAGTMMLTATMDVQAKTKIGNPRIVKDSNMFAGQKVTYDCVYFGSYPQAEVIGSKKKAVMIDKSIKSGKDYIVDATLYKKLKKSKSWDKNGEVVINGNKYRRVKAEDASHAEYNSDYKKNCYQWDRQYHYFKYQPIKWRVLQKTSGEMLLMSDIVLDCKLYNTEYTSVTWEQSTLRSWLNGYGADQNATGQNYKSKSFIKSAFSKSEQKTILKRNLSNLDNLKYDTAGGENTADKVFLLSEKEIYQKSAKKYGFAVSSKIEDEARRTLSSSYAKAMGCWSDERTRYAGTCYWWLRSSGYGVGYAANVTNIGNVYTYGHEVNQYDYGVRPVLIINLKSAHKYKYAGTTCTNGIVKNAK